MKELSDTENLVAEHYCHGFTDKEIADVTGKPIWTVRTHKKHIYKKLNIATTHELVLFMVSKFVGKKWNVEDVRRRGLAALLTLLMIFHIVTVENKDFYRRGRRLEAKRVEREQIDGE